MSRRARGDAGMTLVELLVAMSILVVVVTAFTFMYVALNRSGIGTGQLTASQSSARVVVRVLEADIRSADPLILPQSVSLGNLPVSGAEDADYVVMFEASDPFSPCKTTPVPPSVPDGSVPYVVVPTPNVAWTYNHSTGILTRWSYADCGSGAKWHQGMQLQNVVTPAGQTFFITGAGAQITAMLSGVAALPVCATGMRIRVQTTTKAQTTPFKLDVTLPLPNSGSVEAEACS